MLLMTKLRNQLKKHDEGYECRLRNISVNGQKRGCSGFVRNPANGRIVYVDTESSVYAPLSGKSLVRYADSMEDYTGRGNHYAPQADTAKAIHEMLTAPKSSVLRGLE